MTETLTQPETAAPAPPKGGLNAYLTVDGAMKAAAFYERAFGAETVGVYPPDDQGRTCHAHLYVNGSSLMLSDPFPEHGCGSEGHAGYTLQLHVDDADAWARRAVEAGCELVMPVQEMFWGDRWGQVKDPFGVTWSFNQSQT